MGGRSFPLETVLVNAPGPSMLPETDPHNPAPGRTAVPRRLLRLSLLLLLSAGVARAAGGRTFVDPATETLWLPGGAGSTGGAAGAFVNPAAWALNDRAGAAFWWDDRDRTGRSLENWGFSWGHRLGVSAQHRTYWQDRTVTDWQLGWTTGGDRAALGLAWRFASGDKTAVGRENSLVLGTVHRPGRALSVGAALVHSVESDAREAHLDVGVRPFSSPLLTLFADYTVRGGLTDGYANVGALVQPVPGLQLGVKLPNPGDSGEWPAVFSIGVTLNGLGLHALPGRDGDGHATFTSYLVETESPRAPLPVEPKLFGAEPPRYLALNLENRRITYSKYRWFDDQRIAWLDLARVLRAARDDPDLAGVAVHTAGLRARTSLLWELAHELDALRAAGKEVILQSDRMGMLGMMLAGSADVVCLDPEGELTLPGMDLSRTYFKDLLAKLGLGFRALQYFDHKTAVEALSRSDMSPADREQRGRIVDVFYETVAAAVQAGRGLDPAAFDAIVDGSPMLYADEAVAAGLVDVAQRWPDLGGWLRENRGAVLTGPDPDWFRAYPAERWGAPPTVAVVYALGECAMDTGIRGRATSAYLRSLVDDPDVVAVVLRADSPGGDPLPSDLVAEALVKLKEAGKPVVISQGDVAASGGYWISMAGTEILSTPLTVTGSIGVISGWLWDRELHEKTGVDTDGVSRGAHADLFRQVRYPVGLSLPARDMSDEEAEVAKDRVLYLYDRFVNAVAKHRGLTPERVREIAGGRVWMGGDALGLGLVDGIGGLMDAVDRAGELAGLTEAPRLREYPPRPLVELPKLGLPLPGLGALVALPRLGGVPAPAAPPADPLTALLERLADGNGRPAAVLAPDLAAELWTEAE